MSRNDPEYHKAYLEKNREKIAARRKANRASSNIQRAYHLKSKYGLTEDQYRQMFDDQYYECGICKEYIYPFTGVRGAAVDHCHETGNVRGILCANCNVGLGMFKDNTELFEAAIKYIKRNNG